MAYRKPFAQRAPDFRQVAYEFTFSSEEAALDALTRVKNKMYTIADDGTYLLPVGRRMKSRDETVEGAVLKFIGQYKASEVDLPATQALELEVAGTEGSLTAKTVLS